MKDIYVQVLPVKLLPFQPNLGYWSFDVGDTLRIQVAQMPDWRHTVGILIHELFEAWWCKKNGVTTEQCDAFDEIFQKEYEAGLHKLEDEPGYDSRCVYRPGHVWGDRLARIVLFLLGVRWKTFCDECMKALEE